MGRHTKDWRDHTGSWNKHEPEIIALHFEAYKPDLPVPQTQSRFAAPKSSSLTFLIIFEMNFLQGSQLKVPNFLA